MLRGYLYITLYITQTNANEFFVDFCIKKEVGFTLPFVCISIQLTAAVINQAITLFQTRSAALCYYLLAIY